METQATPWRVACDSNHKTCDVSRVSGGDVLVNFRTKDETVHANAPWREGRNFDKTLCGQYVVTSDDVRVEHHLRAYCTEDSVTCLACLAEA